VPGEEYVPATFSPLTLDENLTRFRSILFGPGADRAMKNYRLRQVLSFIHSSELEEYVTILDPRITYWPPHEDRLFRGLVFGASIKQTSGPSTNFFFQSSQTGFKAVGAVNRTWKVEILDATTIKVDRLTIPTSSKTLTYSSAGGLSSSVPLDGTNLGLIFNTPAIGAIAEVKDLPRPVYSLPEAYTTMLKAGTPASLFGGEEPFRTFRRLWSDDSTPFALRLGSWVLSLGFRLKNATE